MVDGTHQIEKVADLIKKLQKQHQLELRDVHNRQQTQMRTFLAKHKLAYAELETEQDRAALLTTYVQQLSQLKQTYISRQKQLLARQATQRENLITKAIGHSELDRRKRIKMARSIIETYTKSSPSPLLTLPI